MTTEEFQISWLHCNICHRAFEGHNQVKLSGDRIILVHSDLYFYFTACGHFFCENCLKDDISRAGNTVRCKICGEQSQAFKIHSTIPDKVSMYLKPPISLLEDSLSIMMFQLNNANKLITALRAKIGSQKDLLTRAKQEISQAKELKERIKFLEDERSIRAFHPANQVHIDPNETFRIPNEFQQQQQQQQQHPPPPFQSSKSRSGYRGSAQYSPFINRTPLHARESKPYVNYFNPPPDSPLIHTSGRLSLKSPSISNNNNSQIINSNNYQNGYNAALNSPYPGQLRSKQPRPVLRRP